MEKAKYIWARDLVQFDVNDEALEKFEKFDTFNEALQDAIDLFREVTCDNVTNYMKEHGVTIYIAELVYDDLTQQNYFYQILTDIEEIARQDYHHDDVETIVPSDPHSDIMVKYNLKLKKLLDDYLFEIGKKDGAIYPHIINIYQYSDGMIWKLTHENININD